MKAKKPLQTSQISSRKMALMPKYFLDSKIKHPSPMLER
jgi:hypothetical protein